MDDRNFEAKLGRLLRQDLSAGTEAFRDALLARCLDALSEEEEPRQLSDSELDLLAAAGNVYAVGNDGMPSRGSGEIL